MLNQIIIQGRLTDNPELRTTSNGVEVVSFTLAVEQDYTNKTTKERGTDFINVVAWRGSATFVEKYFGKGQMCIVSGRLQIRSYTDRDGIKRRIAEVIAEHVYFSGSKRENGDRENRDRENRDYDVEYTERVTPEAVANTEKPFEELDDGGELPF